MGSVFGGLGLTSREPGPPSLDFLDRRAWSADEFSATGAAHIAVLVLFRPSDDSDLVAVDPCLSISGRRFDKIINGTWLQSHISYDYRYLKVNHPYDSLSPHSPLFVT